MGLHLCYELDMPAELPVARVAEALGHLRLRAADLRFDHVSPAFVVTGDSESAGGRRTERLHSFFAICATGRRDLDGDSRSVEVRPTVALGFVVLPGRGCEAAAFGLARYPEPVTGHPDADAPGVKTLGWHWHTCCKTQYASIVSDEHLIRCHLSLVSLLEEATRIGIRVTVRDETHYWETRDTDRLLDEVHSMNRLVAKLAGRLGDTLPPGLALGGEITRHPRFEDLEME